jgi:hypothetical protein
MSKQRNWTRIKTSRVTKPKDLIVKTAVRLLPMKAKYFSDIFSIEFYNRFKDNDLE